MNEASIHDIAAARRAKRRPEHAVLTPDAKIVSIVRELLSSGKQWKVDKRSSAEAHALKQLARNLNRLLLRVPHGKKGEVLAEAGFGDGRSNSATSYSHNVTLPETGEPSADRWRRLSPNINAYVAVAERCPPGGDASIAQLFRGTLWEEQWRATDTKSEWMPALALALWQLSDEVVHRTALSSLFDSMSAANLCLREGSQHDMAMTDWLSVTFHKTDVAVSGERQAPYWLLDREDEGAPLGGAALFSPKVIIDHRTATLPLANVEFSDFRGTFSDFGELVVQQAVYIALLPVAADLDMPASVEPALLVRPSLKILAARDELAVDFVKFDNGCVKLVGPGIGPQAWFRFQASVEPAAWEGLIAATGVISWTDNETEIDLSTGMSRVYPLGSSECENLLSQSAVSPQIKAPPRPAFVRELLMPGVEPDEVDLSALIPRRFAPQGSLAAHLQRALTTYNPLGDALEADAIAYRAAFERLQSLAARLLGDTE